MTSIRTINGPTWQSFGMARPVISPMPPVADGVALPWDEPVGDAVAVIGEARAVLGDTFVVDSGADRYLFTFSPAGVTELYKLPEERASKGVADWRMLRRKVPDELFAGRRTFPHDLFGRDDSAMYMANVRSALEVTIDELGATGSVDVFDLTRRLGHRVGLASWGGPGSGDQATLDRLIAAFDVLDGSEAFVHPDVMAAVAESGKRAEKAALATVTELLGSSLDRLDADPELDRLHPLFSRIAAAWSGEPAQVRRTGVAHDVALDTYRLDVEPVCRDGLGSDGRAVGRSVVSQDPRRPLGLGRAMCDGVDPNGAAIDHVPLRLGAGHHLRRNPLLRRRPWCDHLNPAPTYEHLVGSRIRPVDPVALEPPPPRRSLDAAGGGARDGFRARKTHLSRPTVLLGGPHGCNDRTRLVLRVDARMGPAPETGARPDRGSRPGVGAVPGRLPQGVATAHLTRTPPSTSRRRRHLILTTGGIAVGIAALTALMYAVSAHVFAGDSDGATVVLEGQSMSSGHLTLHGWALSVDSFWSVDAIFYTLGVLLIGVRSTLLHLVPAFIASLVVLFGVLIAREGRRGAAAIAAGITVVALLGFPGRLLSYFYLRGPLHVGTTLWCLVAFYALRRRRFDGGWLVAVVFLAAGLLGDFQMVALGVVPVLIAGVVAMIRMRSWRSGAPMIAASIASIILAVVVRKVAEIFGTFAIGKLQQGASTSQMLRNFKNLATGAVHMFGVGAGALGAGGVPKALEAVHVVGLVVVVGAILIAVVRLAAGVLRGLPSAVGDAGPPSAGEPTEDWVLDDLLLFGLVGGVIVFIALSNNNAFEFDRYMTSAVIFASVMGARLVGSLVERIDSAFLLRSGAVIGLAVVAALLAGAVFEAEAATPVGDFTQVSQFLEAHHLDNGIGDYTDASIITVATGGEVKVRPVSGDSAERIVRYQRQSDAAWYAGQSFQFVLYDSGIPGSFDAVTASLTFGPPLRTYAIGNFRVLVWAHPISVSVNGYDPG